MRLYWHIKQTKLKVLPLSINPHPTPLPPVVIAFAAPPTLSTVAALPVIKTVFPSVGRLVARFADCLEEKRQQAAQSPASTRKAGRQRVHSLSSSTVAASQATSDGMALMWDARIFFTTPPTNTDITPM